MIVTCNHLNLDQIAQSGQCFRWERIDEGAYSIPAYGIKLFARQVAHNAIDVDCSTCEWDEVWSRYFDIHNDYGAVIERIAPNDKYLAAAAAYGSGIRLLQQPLWETMASFIISQNNNIPRIKAIIKRLCAGRRDFPSAEEIALKFSPVALRAIGLGYRAEYLHEAACRYMAAPDTHRRLRQMTYEDARMYLMSYEGIGAKVADCICLYGLQHYEAFPLDKWMKRIVRNHYDGRFPSNLYAGIQGVLQQYMFFYERSMAV